ncbi:hypothetical protein BMS3Abin15_01004 [bacterium BMS3Abin15]|nr:hypothetical protein BMS3Abin15_01004 [bacterium BMS3Abin15]
MNITLSTEMNVLIIALLSVINERIFDMIKPYIPSLSGKKKDEAEEAKRRSRHYILSAALGFLMSTVFINLVRPIFPFFFDMGIVSGRLGEVLGILKGCAAVGLLLGAGAGLWNSVFRIIEELRKWRKVIETVNGMGIVDRRGHAKKEKTG